jgi:hypothetical protein
MCARQGTGRGHTRTDGCHAARHGRAEGSRRRCLRLARTPARKTVAVPPKGAGCLSISRWCARASASARSHARPRAMPASVRAPGAAPPPPPLTILVEPKVDAVLGAGHDRQRHVLRALVDGHGVVVEGGGPEHRPPFARRDGEVVEAREGRVPALLDGGEVEEEGVDPGAAGHVPVRGDVVVVLVVCAHTHTARTCTGPTHAHSAKEVGRGSHGGAGTHTHAHTEPRWWGQQGDARRGGGRGAGGDGARTRARHGQQRAGEATRSSVGPACDRVRVRVRARAQSTHRLVLVGLGLGLGLGLE